MESSDCQQMNKPTFKSNLKIDQLPNDIYYFYLFPYLTINDILNLRSMNKKLLAKADLYNLRELNFRYHFNFKNNWFSTTRSIKLSNQLSIRRLRILKRPIQMLTKLKYLKINCVIKNNFKSDLLKIDDLNEFTQLEILELEDFYLDPLRNHHLCLPNLQALAIENPLVGKGFYLSIETPLLHSLSMSDLGITERFECTIRKIRFKHPLSIKYLQTLNYHHSSIVFRNLECLQVSDIKSNEDIDGLLRFEHLKKIKIVNDHFEMDKLRRLFSLKEQRRDLMVVFLGLNITNFDLIDKYEQLNHELKIQQLISNYNELEDNLNFVKRINYTHLKPSLSLLNHDNQLQYFFRKYTNIQGIKIEKEEVNELILIRLIKKCSNLMYLWICHSELSQEFYDQLASATCLFRLHVKASKAVNFKFLMAMEYLTHFYTNLDVEFGDDVNLNDLKYFRELCIYLADGSVVIDKMKADSYMIKCSETLYDETDVGQLFDFRQVIQFWSDLKNRRKLFTNES